MVFAGTEFDHIITTPKGNVYLIELHGYQHYLSTMGYDYNSNKLYVRTNSTFSGKTQLKNNFVKNLGFDKF